MLVLVLLSSVLSDHSNVVNTCYRTNYYVGTENKMVAARYECSNEVNKVSFALWGYGFCDRFDVTTTQLFFGVHPLAVNDNLIDVVLATSDRMDMFTSRVRSSSS
jgi:hypothetical protein